MIYRVEIDASFTDKKDAENLLNHIENIKDKTYKPKGTEKVVCRLNCRYHACSHDEANPVPCKDYIHIDFKADKTTHKL